MKICIYGAGAIGGFLAVELASAGLEVACIARGPHLAAMRARGLKLVSERGERVARVTAVERPAELGPQDYVVVALKAPGAAAAADQMAPLLGPHTAVVTAQNGIPWWYFYRHGGPHDGRRLETVDPGGRQWNLIGPERAIGCVVYPSAEVIEPGVVKLLYGNRFMLGEPDGSKSERIAALSRALTQAGLKAPVRPRIRDDIWVKLWGNLSFNPISVLTGGTLAEIAFDPGTRAVVRSMMVEAQVIGEKLGVRFPIEVEQRIDGGAEVGDHKTSTLQDFERRRPLEIDALIGAVAELGRLTETPTPTIDMINALVRQRAKTAGCLPG